AGATPRTPFAPGWRCPQCHCGGGVIVCLIPPPQKQGPPDSIAPAPAGASLVPRRQVFGQQLPEQGPPVAPDAAPAPHADPIPLLDAGGMPRREDAQSAVILLPGVIPRGGEEPAAGGTAPAQVADVLRAQPRVAG